ncbi:hypothetical protein M413DRAFT_419985 [Hebeloma cylindrosporum]|uniref:Uncharacterized protein n=1 Tax=Hebeloma cylindrosporum TaxID=76867 RepID=A0A0C3C4X6_HEBCY|nr:hypothetical protein M413DRAFT_419985 [Hebeloma cylindrosporum h7]
MSDSSSSVPSPSSEADVSANDKEALAIIFSIYGAFFLLAVIICCRKGCHRGAPISKPDAGMSLVQVSARQLEAGDGAGDTNDGCDGGDEPPGYVQNGGMKSSESVLPPPPSPPIIIGETTDDELTSERQHQKSSTSLPIYTETDGSETIGSRQCTKEECTFH